MIQTRSAPEKRKSKDRGHGHRPSTQRCDFFLRCLWFYRNVAVVVGAGRCELHSGSLSQAPKCKQPPSQQNEISFEAPLGGPQERAIPRRTPQESTEQVNDWHRQAPYEHTISVRVPDVTHHDIAVRTMNVSRDLTVGLVDLGSILRLGSVSLI